MYCESKLCDQVVVHRSQLIAATCIVVAAFCTYSAGCGFATTSPTVVTIAQAADASESNEAINERTSQLHTNPNQGRLYSVKQAPANAPRFSMNGGMNGGGTVDQIMLFSNLQFGVQRKWNAAFVGLHSCATGHAGKLGDERFVLSGSVQLDLGTPVRLEARAVGSIDMAEYELVFADPVTQKPLFLAALSEYVQETKQRAEDKRQEIASRFHANAVQAMLEANLWLKIWDGMPDATLFVTLSRNATCGTAQVLGWQTALLDALLYSIYLDQQAKGEFNVTAILNADCPSGPPAA